MDQLPMILGFAVIIAGIAIVNILVNKANKQKRYEAKVKAGIIKDGEEIPTKTEAEKKAEMEAAMKLATKRPEGKK